MSTTPPRHASLRGPVDTAACARGCRVLSAATGALHRVDSPGLHLRRSRTGRGAAHAGRRRRGRSSRRSSGTAPAATTTARRWPASASRGSRRRASASTPTCSRRPCARCAAASCRRRARASPSPPPPTRWWPGSKRSLDRAAGHGRTLPDQRRAAPVEPQGVRERRARSAGGRRRRRRRAAGRRRRGRLRQHRDGLQVSPSFIEQYVDRRARRRGEGDGPARRAPRRLDVPRRPRHAAHARARSAARHARRHPRQRRPARPTASTSSTSPTWPPTSGATAWSSRTRSS